MTDNLDVESNFWVVNIQCKIHKPFKELYNKDKSKGKKESSKIMWGIALLVDPVRSRYRNLLESEKLSIIAEDWFGDIDFSWKNIKGLIEAFEKLQLTKIERSIRDWGMKIEERDAFIKKTRYSMETADNLDRILINTTKIYDLYKKAIEEYLKNRGEEGRTQGGKPESAGEKKLL